MFDVPAWLVMWSLGIAVFFALKTALLVRRPPHSPLGALQFLFGTPALDAAPYAKPPAGPLPPGRWWHGIVGLVLCGGALLLGVPLVRDLSPWLAGVVAMAGICGGLHFGLFEFFVAAQRRLGYDTRPIMDRPWAAENLSEFWGRRWNRAFRDAAQTLVARPLLRRRWPAWLVLAIVFLASGLIHDLVMSAPAGGWGRPTAYFLIQAAGTLLQRTRPARAIGADRGWFGRLLAAAAILLPLPLLFHRPYCVEIMLPFYDWLAGLVGWDGRWSREGMVFAGGWMQWSVLIASALVPISLDWKSELAALSSIVAQLFWTYGGYLVGAILFLGAASVFWADEIAAAEGLGRGVALATAAFWFVRLLLGWFVFDAEPFLDRTWKRVGYELLNVNFALLSTLYATVALTPSA